MSRTAAGSGRAVLEGVGLSHEAIQMCYKNSQQNEEEAIQSGLMKWRDGSGDSPTWTVLIEAMEYAEIGLQHVKKMKEILLEGEVFQLIGRSSISTNHNNYVCVIGSANEHICRHTVYASVCNPTFRPSLKPKYSSKACILLYPCFLIIHVHGWAIYCILVCTIIMGAASRYSI